MAAEGNQSIEWAYGGLRVAGIGKQTVLYEVDEVHEKKLVWQSDPHGSRVLSRFAAEATAHAADSVLMLGRLVDTGRRSTRQQPLRAMGRPEACKMHGKRPFPLGEMQLKGERDGLAGEGDRKCRSLASSAMASRGAY